jgi:hypothetical protein
MKKTIKILLTVTLIIGCGRSDTIEFADEKGMSASPMLVESEILPPERSLDNNDVPELLQIVPERKIIKNGFLEIKSDNIHHSKQRIDSLTKKYDCYIADEGFQESYNMWTYNFTIRIEADSFDEFMNDLLIGPDVIKNKNINTQDVTEQYYDLTARLETNLAVENRYKELLNKAQNIKDVLEIEKSIAEIRGEIESQQGRLNRMKNQIAFSTLNINLYQDKSIKEASVTRDPFSKRMAKSIINGWDGFISFLIGFVTLWPFWVLVIVAWRTIVYFSKKRKG